MRRMPLLAATVAAVFAIILVNPLPARAQPLRLAEELARRLIRQEGRQVEGRILATDMVATDAGRSELADATEGLARRTRLASGGGQAISARFDRLRGVDEGLRAEFQALSAADQQLAVEMTEATQHVLNRFPAEEGERVLRALDSPGLLQTRIYGNAVADGTAWLTSDEVLTALRATPLTAEEASSAAKLLRLGGRPETLDPEQAVKLWRSALQTSDGGAARFWNTYVSGHKGKWLAAGLLTSYLAMPDKFHDALGRLTAYGAQRLTAAGIDAVGAVGGGIGNGVMAAIRERYAVDPAGTLVRLTVAVLLVVAAVPPLRRLAAQIVRGSRAVAGTVWRVAVRVRRPGVARDRVDESSAPAGCHSASGLATSARPPRSGFPLARPAHVSPDTSSID